MFVLRDDDPPKEVRSRQRAIWSVIRGDTPLTIGVSEEHDFVRTLAACVYGHRAICPLRKFKILKSLDGVLNLMNSSDVTERQIYSLIKRATSGPMKGVIEKYLDDVTIEVGDTIRLPVFPPVSAFVPLRPPIVAHRLKIVPTTDASLSEFERTVFDNRVLYQFYEGVTLSTYVYQNIMFMLDQTTTASLDHDDRWQARLAALIKRTHFTDAITAGAFYKNIVTYSGQTYDTTFVPKFDVNRLKRLSRIGLKRIKCKNAAAPRCAVQSSINDFGEHAWENQLLFPELLRSSSTVTAGKRDEANETIAKRDHVSLEELLAYRVRVNVRKVEIIPERYMGIFLTFPFKDSHYVRPNGEVRYVDVLQTTGSVVSSAIQRIRNASTLEEDVVDAAKSLSLQDVLAYALLTEELESQGVALLIMRQMIGSVLVVNGMHIRLPFNNEVLEWLAGTSFNNADDVEPLELTKISASPKQSDIMLFTTIALIKDIARSVQTKLAATFVCSSFHLLECHYGDVYKALVTDAERYVFLTLIIQEHNINHYRRYRDFLKPEFGNQSAGIVEDLTIYEDPQAFLLEKGYSVHVRSGVSTSIMKRLDAMTVSMISPTEISTSLNLLNPDKHIDRYAFLDPQLSALAESGYIDLNGEQLASYIALSLD